MGFRKAIFACVFSAPLLFVPMPEYAQCILATIVQFGFGYQFYVWRSLGMNTLIALGTTAAYLFSLYQWYVGGPLYFDTAAIIIAIVLLGRAIENYSQRRAKKSVEALVSMVPKQAERVDGTLVSVSELEEGDCIRVQPGGQFPVDGEIVSGTTSADESMLTGESLPVPKQRGDSVFAGSINVEGSVEVMVTGDPQKTYVNQLIDLVKTASESRPPVQKLVDTVSARFVPAVLGISIITFIVWSFTSFTDALVNAVSVLVVACPCALGLATPIVILVATTRAARRGILFKDITALQTMASVKGIVFDKTGTITKGKLAISRVEGDVGSLAKSLGRLSSHPLARACVKIEAEEQQVQGFIEVPGKGVRGKIAGTEYMMGSSAFLREAGAANLPEIDETAIFVGTPGSYLGYVVVEDELRPGIKEMIKSLKLKTAIVSGDRQTVVKKVAEQVGVDEWFGEKTPNAKVEVLKELQKNGPVAMIGDGINDAAALASASVGIAIGSGTDVAMESSDVGLMGSPVEGVPTLLLISRRTMGKIAQNLFFAFCYNTVGIFIAAFGYLHPMIAATAMALSSISVVINALTLRVKPHR